MANLYFRCRIVTQTSRPGTLPGTPPPAPINFPEPVLNALPFELAGAASRMGNYMIPDDKPEQYLKYVGQRVLWGPGIPPPPAMPLDVALVATGHREVQGVWVTYGDKSYVYSITQGNTPLETKTDLPGAPVQHYYLVFDPV